MNSPSLIITISHFTISEKFVSLKSTLEKLINKSQVESDDFKIFLKVPEIDDTNETSYNKQINGEIKNKFFEPTFFLSSKTQNSCFVLPRQLIIYP